MLNHLPKVQLEVSAAVEHNQQDNGVRVRLHNPSRNLAFQIRLEIQDEKREEEILPVFWEDNYLSLLPGESREIVARYSISPKLEGHPQLQVSGWNVEELTIPLEIWDLQVGSDSKVVLLGIIDK
jgi:exo-1,4-beta-D-glucosaminidase